ncbi:hypothetical protein NWQ33_00685 [Mycoplasmopsis cynos]|nr:hypothetical protein [Mycoplasmopsis cynos]
MEVSFTDVETFQSKIEKLFKYAMKKVMNVDIQIPFQRVNYDDCIRDYGLTNLIFRYDKK